MSETIEFSKLAVPDANGVPTYVYQVKDAAARQALSGAMKFIIAWDGKSTPVVSKIPNTVSVRYNDTVYTGTLNPAVAHDNNPMAFWLVSNGEGGDDGYSEYVPVEDDSVTPSTFSWEKLGDVAMSLSDLGALAYMDSVDLSKGNGVNVIGENATLQSSSSAVSFGTHTTDKVLGVDTTFTASGPTITDNSTKQSLSVEMGSVPVPDTTNTESVVTDLKSTGTGTNDTKKADVLTASSLTKRKIKTESIRGVKTTLTTATGATGRSYKKLGKKQIYEADDLTITGSDLVGYDTKKIVSKTITVPSGTDTVNGVSSTRKKKLITDTFKKVTSPNGESATVKGLSVSMYNSATHGTIQGADAETLVLAFSTTPTLTLSSSDTRFATGALLASDASGYAAEQGEEVVDKVTTTSKNIVTGTTTDTVADPKLASSGTGESVVTEIKLDSSITAARKKSSATWVGSGATVASTTTGDTAGSQVVDDMNENVSVNVPDLATSDVTVMTSDTTSGNDGIELVDGVNANNTANAYTDLKFTKQSVLKTTTTQTPTAKLKLGTAAAASSVDVVTQGGVSVTGSYGVTVGNNDRVDALTALGTATAAAQDISFANKDLKKVPLYDDLKIVTESHPAERYLNLTPPTAGTIILAKLGNPTTVDLEISRDGVNWTDWTEESNGNRSVNVVAGERIYFRNKSVISTRFSLPGGGGNSNHYAFSAPAMTVIGGLLESLLCRNPENAVASEYCFKRLFYQQTRFAGNVKSISKYLPQGAMYQLLSRGSLSTSSNIESVTINATSYAPYALFEWLDKAGSNGTIYCPAELTLEENSVSGVPTGWTRVDI